MGDENTRATATQLITQLAELIGVQSPTTSTIRTESNAGPTVPAVLPVRSVPGPSTSSNVSVRSEMSHLFAPYPRLSTSAGGLRLAGRPAHRQRPTSVRQSREWSGRFCCLAGPFDPTTPNDAKMLILKRHGLGDGVITTDYLANAETLKQAMESAFPKLSGIDVGLYRALTGGKGKPVVRISNTELIPSVPYLRASRAGLIYILPSSNLIDEPVEQEVNRPGQQGGSENVEVQPDRPQQIHSNRELIVVQDLPIQNTESDQQTQSPETDNEPLTLEDYRAQVYLDHEGYQYILASREKYLEKILGIYKDPRLNLLKKPKIEFQGESGADIGAITREYFWRGLTSLTQDKLDGLPLFEGEMNHKIPSTDGRLLRSGVFKTIGKFMSHAALHCGIAFLGLSEAVSQYLVLDNVDSDTPLPITVNDVPEIYVREALELLTKVKSGATLSEEEAVHVQAVAESSEFGEVVTPLNAGFVIDQVLYHCVVDRRSRQLEAMKCGFKSTGVAEYLIGKPYLLPPTFPRSTDFDYPPSLIIEKIQCNENSEKLGVIKQFIQSLAQVPQGLQTLLSAWTGWAVLPEDHLAIRFEADVDFEVHTCFNELVIPLDLSSSEIIEKLNLLINYGSNGFGGV